MKSQPIALMLLVLVCSCARPISAVPQSSTTGNLTIATMPAGLSLQPIDASKYKFALKNESANPIDLIALRWDWGKGSRTVIYDDYFLSNTPFAQGQTLIVKPEQIGDDARLSVDSKNGAGNYAKIVKAQLALTLSVDLMISGNTKFGPDKSGTFARMKQRGADIKLIAARSKSSSRPDVSDLAVMDQARINRLAEFIFSKAPAQVFLSRLVQNSSRFPQ